MLRQHVLVGDMVNILHLHQLSFFFPFFGLSDSFLSLFPFPTKQTRNKWIWAEFPFGNTDDESKENQGGGDGQATDVAPCSLFAQVISEKTDGNVTKEDS